MKILGISGGTKNGNNDAMCREALMGVKEVCPNAEIEFIRLLDLDLKPCTGCIACTFKMMQGKNMACVHTDDDFAWLNDKLLEADGVIFTIPIFEKGAPAVFKILQDKFGGPSHDRGLNTVCKKISEEKGTEGPDPRLFRDKPISFIAIGGSDWSTRVSCDERLFAMVPMWKVIDDVVFSWSKAIAVEDEKVAKCHEVGVNMANAVLDFEHAKYLGDPGVCPHCNSRNFYLNDDATKAICEVCGIEGELKIVGGKVTFSFTEEAETHAHDILSGKLMHGDDIGRNEGGLLETKKTEKYQTRMASYKDFISATLPPR